MAYKYIGNPYPPDVGVLLAGINVPLFPHRMNNAEVRLLLDEYPNLRRFWENGTSTGGGGSGGAVGDEDADGNGVPDNLDPILWSLRNVDTTQLVRSVTQLSETVSTLQSIIKSIQ
jgi:hypothetical protein